MKGRDLYSLLRERLQSRPTRDFDDAFWAKFEARFSEKPRHGWFALPWLSRLGATSGLMAGLALVLWLSRPHASPPFVATSLDEDPAEQAALFTDLDFWIGYDEVANLSDEDWNALTGEPR